jgi:hypothetical protein
VLRSQLREVLTNPEHGIAEQLTPLINAFDDVGKPRSVIEWLNASPGSLLLHELAVRAHHEAITHELLDRYPQTNDLAWACPRFVLTRCVAGPLHLGWTRGGTAG